MSSDFEKILVDKLLSFEEIDWEEDRVTLRVMSDGEHSDAEEAEVWGKALGNIATTIVNKLARKYDASDEKVIELYQIIQTNIIKEFRSEIADNTSNEG